MTPNSIPCRLRTLRRKSGLSQRELAHVVGFLSEVPVSRHEHSATAPHLLTAIGYEIIFRTLVSELFPGMYQTVEAGIEERLAELENKLQQSTVKGRAAAVVALKLEFLCERKDPEFNRRSA